MKVWILYPDTTPIKSNAFEWFCSAFSLLGIEAQVKFFHEEHSPANSSTIALPSVAVSSEDGQERSLTNSGCIALPSVAVSKEELLSSPLPDLVVLRGYNSPLSRSFEARGVRVINSTDSMELCRDKIATTKALEAASIPTPRTITFSKPQKYEVPLSAFAGKPFVLKRNTGSKGENVYLIENEEDYLEAMRECSGYKVLFQEYIDFSKGRDLRVWVIGDKVVGHLLRYNPNSFKSNFAAGGSARDCPLPKEAQLLAVAASQCLGLDFAGVDLLFLPDGHFTVCEVNGNAGFRTASLVGGMDIPSELANYCMGLS